MDNLFLEGFDLLEVAEMDQTLNNIIPESVITENELLIELYQTQTEVMEQNRMVMEQLHYEYVNEGAADVFKKIGHAIGEIISKLIGLFKKVINFLFHKNKNEDKKLEENADKASKTVESNAKECKKKVQLLLTTNSKDQNFTVKDKEEEPSKPISGTDSRSGQLSLEDKYGKILEEIEEIESKKKYNTLCLDVDYGFTFANYCNTLNGIINEPLILKEFKNIETCFDILNKKEYKKIENLNLDELEKMGKEDSIKMVDVILSKIGYNEDILNSGLSRIERNKLINKYQGDFDFDDTNLVNFTLNKYLKYYEKDKKIFENIPQNRDKIMQTINSELKKLESLEKEYRKIRNYDDEDNYTGPYAKIISYFNKEIIREISYGLNNLLYIYRVALSGLVNCEKMYEIHKRNLKQLCSDQKRLNELKSNFGKQRF